MQVACGVQGGEASSASNVTSLAAAAAAAGQDAAPSNQQLAKIRMTLASASASLSPRVLTDAFFLMVGFCLPS